MVKEFIFLMFNQKDEEGISFYLLFAYFVSTFILGFMVGTIYWDNAIKIRNNTSSEDLIEEKSFLQ